MDTEVLVTGGAGFIGSHLATELIQQGYRVRILDAPIPHVDGEDATHPQHRPQEAVDRVDRAREELAARGLAR